MEAIRTFRTSHCPNICPVLEPEDGRSVPVISEVTGRNTSLQLSASTEGASLPFEPPLKAATPVPKKKKERKRERETERRKETKPTDDLLPNTPGLY